MFGIKFNCRIVYKLHNSTSKLISVCYCILLAVESDENDGDWENDLEGTDGSDVQNVIDQTTQNIPTEGPTKDERLRTLLFSPTSSSDYIPSSAPATGVDEEENESNNENHDLGRQSSGWKCRKIIQIFQTKLRNRKG